MQLDGERITDLNIQDYRKHMALVSQEPTLYAGTVRFNIMLGAIKPEAEVTQEEIEDACRKANILEFVQGLPQYVTLSLALPGGPYSDPSCLYLGALTRRSAAKAPSYPAGRSVSVFLNMLSRDDKADFADALFPR